MKTKTHLVKSIVTFVVAIALIIGMIPIMPNDVIVSAKETVTLTIMTGEVTLNNGDVLTGKGGPNTHVTIADGAKVTLSGVTITSIKNDSSHTWAGITCLGDAEIVLAEGTINKVTGAYRHPGVYIPENKTLTISGSGILDAESASDNAAGIGGGLKNDSCDYSCGNIVINGGGIIAKGGLNGAGIGSGLRSRCGDITINNGVGFIEATKGSNAPDSIGAGAENGRCGTVTIFNESGVKTDNYTYYNSSINYKVKFDANGGTGSMSDQSFTVGISQALTSCSFTRDGYTFIGWKTSTISDGTVDFVDQDSVVSLAAWNCATVTLYAMWRNNNSDIYIDSSTGEIKLTDGQTLTGTGGTNTHVIIADGATVTLNNVTINGTNSSKYLWAGITCEGDATIVLADGSINTVKGFYEEYPGIYIPENKTLTIQGSGWLEASNNGYACGIGGGLSHQSCGNIIIKSGIIKAHGELWGPGIGPYDTATSGNITIEDGVTYLEATKNYDGAYGIRARGGTVTIFGVKTDSIKDNYTYDSSKTYTVKFDSNGGTGSMSDLKLALGEPKVLPKCEYTKTGAVSAGWSKTANGDLDYKYGNWGMDLAPTNSTITLYAVWKSPNLNTATISGTSSYLYTGSPISIKYTVTDEYSNLLTKGVHYSETIKKDDNVVTSVTDIGTYTLNLTGIGNCEGSKEFSFNVVNYPEDLSIDNDYKSDEIGYYYVNMPSGQTVTKTVTILDGFTSSFKVYDDGGKKGEYFFYNDRGFRRKIVLKAPKGYKIQLTGSVGVYANNNVLKARLKIYNGTPSNLGSRIGNEGYGENSQSGEDIGILVSDGEEVTLDFSGNETNGSNFGLNITVTLVKSEVPNSITINPSSGGSVSSDKSYAKIGDIVTLTATPSNETCLLSSIVVKDSDNNIIPLSNDICWYSGVNTATFAMPGSEVTVTPVFTRNWTATDGGLSITMPTNGSIDASNIPLGVQSFKVYLKSNGSNGKGTSTLKLTAPKDYLIDLSGKVKYELKHMSGANPKSKFYVFDGENASATKLIDDSTNYNVNNNYSKIISSGESVYIYSESQMDTEWDIDLTITLISSKEPLAVNVSRNIANGQVISNSDEALPNSYVTLTVNPEDGYVLQSISAIDNDGKLTLISSTNGSTWGDVHYYTDNEFIFKMRSSAVNVSATFIAKKDFFVNIPKSGSIKEFEIPEDTEIFKVYDNSGKDGTYGYNNDGFLLLTAPQGHVMKISGYVKLYPSSDDRDYLDIYDGNSIDATSLGRFKNVSSAGKTVETTGSTNQILLHFVTDYVDNVNSGGGVYLTVSVLPTYNVIIADEITGGTVKTDKSSTVEGETVTLTATPDTGYIVKNISVNNGAVVTDNQDGTYTFTMPAEAVTVNAEFEGITPLSYDIYVRPIDTNGNTNITANITGTGSYVYGTKAVLNANYVEGYNFVGWFASTETNFDPLNAICTTNKWEPLVNAEASYLAVYKPLGNASLKIYGGSDFTINGESKSTEITADYPLGSKITVETNVDRFAYWQNKYGMVLSRSKSFTFTVTGADEITAVFDTVADNKAMIVFESAYGQVLLRKQLASGESNTISLPGLPTLNGYTAQGWDLDGNGSYDSSSDTIEAAISRGLADASKTVTIKPIYVLKNDTYTVTVNGGAGSGTYNQNDVVTVTANTPESGKKFSHWEDAAGKILSYSSSYDFYAEKDITLTAVYVEDSSVVEVKGTTEMVNMYMEDDQNGKKNLIFVSMSTVPQGCTIKKAGVILTDDSTIGTDENQFTDVNADYVLGDEWSGDAYRYTLTVSDVSSGETWYARAYLVYTDVSGNTLTVYGDIVYQTY